MASLTNHNHRKNKQETSQIRDYILVGYQDAISGKMKTFSGNLLKDIKDFKKSNSIRKQR